MKDPRFLARFGIKVNQPLAGHTAIKVGGNADFFVTIDDKKEFVKVLDAAFANGLKVAVLGAGTNVVVSDHGFRGLVIQNRLTGIDIGHRTATAASGVPMGRLVQELATEGYGGLEAFVTLPGTVGAAIRGNAGIGKEAIGNHLTEVQLYSKGSVITVTPIDLQFGYRDSRLKQSGEQVVSATFNVIKKPADEITKAMLAATQLRLRSRPGAEAAVRIFRDPLPETVGELAAQVDLPGERVGKAVISQKDPNYIINEGGARASEIYELAQRIKHRVSVKLGKQLKEEVVWLGEW